MFFEIDYLIIYENVYINNASTYYLSFVSSFVSKRGRGG